MLSERRELVSTSTVFSYIDEIEIVEFYDSD